MSSLSVVIIRKIKTKKKKYLLIEQLIENMRSVLEIITAVKLGLKGQILDFLAK